MLPCTNRVGPNEGDEKWGGGHPEVYSVPIPGVYPTFRLKFLEFIGDKESTNRSHPIRLFKEMCRAPFVLGLRHLCMARAVRLFPFGRVYVVDMCIYIHSCMCVLYVYCMHV